MNNDDWWFTDIDNTDFNFSIGIRSILAGLDQYWSPFHQRIVVSRQTAPFTSWFALVSCGPLTQ